MSDDIPLLILSDGSWSPFGPSIVPELLLAVILSIGCGLIIQALVLGVQTRAIQRPAAWRSLQGALILLVLATAAWQWTLGVSDYLEANYYSDRQQLSHGLFGYWGDGLLAAFASSVLFAFLLAGLAPRRNGPGWNINLGYGIAKFLTPWAGRNGGKHADDSSDFEITMASGQEVEAAERELIENILEMGDTTVREVMKPRPDVIAIDVSWPCERILTEIAAARFSRFPVYEATIDNIIGVLHLRNLFEVLARGDNSGSFNVRELLMEPLFLPESKKVDDALRDLQKHKGHLAIVLDEYGGTAGIATIEDLLEEIVGEIQDEYDEESKLVHQREDGSYVVTAQLPLDDLAELLDLPLTSEEVDTVGGFITHALGRIPAVNDTLDNAGLRFTVLSVEKNRIGRVRVERQAG